MRAMRQKLLWAIATMYVHFATNKRRSIVVTATATLGHEEILKRTVRRSLQFLCVLNLHHFTCRQLPGLPARPEPETCSQ
jgi:hypothetical protein